MELGIASEAEFEHAKQFIVCVKENGGIGRFKFNTAEVLQKIAKVMKETEKGIFDGRLRGENSLKQDVVEKTCETKSLTL